MCVIYLDMAKRPEKVRNNYIGSSLIEDESTIAGTSFSISTPRNVRRLSQESCMGIFYDKNEQKAFEEGSLVTENSFTIDRSFMLNKKSFSQEKREENAKSRSPRKIKDRIVSHLKPLQKICPTAAKALKMESTTDLDIVEYNASRTQYNIGYL